MKKTNNKGFSLVELIIVIAIMVILVAVIAPQYLKFVNNSRVSTDVQTAAEMATAIDVAIANGEHPFGTDTDTSKASLTCTNLSAMPASKLTGSSDKWTVYGNDVNGVSRITLKAKDASGSEKDYECYPNPEVSGSGIANTTASGGLKK